VDDVLDGDARREVARGDGHRAGRRYADDELGLELVCTGAGTSVLTVDGRPLSLRGIAPYETPGARRRTTKAARPRWNRLVRLLERFVDAHVTIVDDGERTYVVSDPDPVTWYSVVYLESNPDEG
jgi:hypothetical protein